MSKLFLIASLLLMSGCVSYRAPSIREHKEILSALTSFERNQIDQQGRMDIRIHKNDAVAYYIVDYEGAAQPWIPKKAKLSRISGKWNVTSSKSNFSLCRRLQDHFINFYDRYFF